MALPLFRRTTNIRRTVESAIGNTVTADGDTWQVLHNWRWGDPDEARDPATTPDYAWVTTTWLIDGAMRRGVSTIQVDAWSRIGAEGAADGDPFGDRCESIMAVIEDVFAGVKASGSFRGCIEVLDFTVNPLAPVGTGRHIVCLTPGGAFGMPSSTAEPVDIGGLNRMTRTFSFRSMLDLSGSDGQYYTYP